MSSEAERHGRKAAQRSDTAQRSEYFVVIGVDIW